MNIVLIYKHSNWISEHVLASFLELKANIIPINARELSRDRLHQEISNVTSDLEVDVAFMMEIFDRDISQQTLLHLRQRNVLTIDYLVDVPQDWWKAKDVANNIDIILVAQRENSARLRREGNRVILFPFAVSHKFASSALSATRPVAGAPLGPPLFLGSAHSRWRLHFVRELSRRGLTFDLVGAGWTADAAQPNARSTPTSNAARYDLSHHIERVMGSGLAPPLGAVLHRMLPLRYEPPTNAIAHGALPADELRSLACSAEFQVSTAVHGSGFLLGAPMRQVKLRDVEMVCFGRPYLTDADLSGGGLSETDLGITRYSSLDSLFGAIAQIRRSPEQATHAAERGAAAVLANHTWRSRFEYLSEITGLEFR